MGEHAYAHVPVMAGRIAALLLPVFGPAGSGNPRRFAPSAITEGGNRLAPGKWRQAGGSGAASRPAGQLVVGRFSATGQRIPGSTSSAASENESSWAAR